MYVFNTDQPNGVFDVTSDFSDPSNPFNQIWNELVPDKTDEIQEEYANRVSAASADLWGSVGTDFAKDVGKDFAKKGTELLLKKAVGGVAASALKGPVGGAAFNLVYGAISNHIKAEKKYGLLMKIWLLLLLRTKKILPISTAIFHKIQAQLSAKLTPQEVIILPL